MARFEKGNPGGPGRAPGSSKLKELEGMAVDVIRGHLEDNDLDAARYVYDQVNGRAKQAMVHSGGADALLHARIIVDVLATFPDALAGIQAKLLPEGTK